MDLDHYFLVRERTFQDLLNSQIIIFKSKMCYEYHRLLFTNLETKQSKMYIKVKVIWFNSTPTLKNHHWHNGSGDQCSVPGQVIPKTQKMVLDTSLLNTQHYKVMDQG